MLGLKLNHVSKRGPSCRIFIYAPNIIMSHIRQNCFLAMRDAWNRTPRCVWHKIIGPIIAILNFYRSQEISITEVYHQNCLSIPITKSKTDQYNASLGNTYAWSQLSSMNVVVLRMNTKHRVLNYHGNTWSCIEYEVFTAVIHMYTLIRWYPLSLHPIF